MLASPPASRWWVLTATVLLWPTLGYGQQPAGPRPAVPGRSLLRDAVQTIERCDSISAKIRHEAELFDKHLVGSGAYWEQRRGNDHLLRLELRTQLGDKSTSLVQVCDGRFLWTYRKLPSEVRLSRIDAVRATKAIEQAEKLPTQPDMAMLPSLGGLSRVLRAIDNAFDFSTVEQGRWGKRNVWRLRGHWRDGYLVRLLPAQKGQPERGEPPDLSKLPEHLPDHVVLLLGQDDRFPYRIEYRRTVPEKGSSSGDVTTRALVTLDLYEVNINAPVDPSHFVYSPGDADFADQTELFLQSLGATP